MSDMKNKYRFAHTMIRVTDLQQSLDFYTRLLGMRILRQKEYPDGKFTNTFIGYGAEDSDTVIELTYNWNQREPYDKGNGWGHIALEVPDVYATCSALESEGVSIPRPAGPMKHGTRVIAFIEDPDGYKIELLEPLA
jgi:lactoylglutathione lyase